MARMSFALLRSALLCLTGSRVFRRVNLELSDIDLDIEKGKQIFIKALRTLFYFLLLLVIFSVRMRLPFKLAK